tara:strand:- start:1414 stop:2469 length:1056 start_codon:yes stop_codon:yes gene_type:complete
LIKIATIIGARPQFIKAAPVSAKINSNVSISEVIIHTGQHYEINMSDVFFNEMHIPEPKYNLNINQIEYGQMIKKMTKEISKLLLKEKIDGLLVYGDTNSTLAGSLSSKKLDIPLFHIEAGLRSFDRLMYEENNRIITDHLSSLLFCPTQNAVENLIKENMSEGLIFSGDVMYDAYLNFNSKDNLVSEKYKNLKYVLATIHRRENINSSERLLAIFESLNKLDSKQKIIMPIHPHTKQKIEKYKIQSNIDFIEPQGYLSMISLLKNCEMVITDSGGLQKESYFAKKKCIVVREHTEWVELIDQGTNVLCKPENIYNAFSETSKKECDFSENLYGNGKASAQIVESIIQFLS